MDTAPAHGPTGSAVWGGAVLYAVALGVLLSGSPDGRGTFHGLGSLLALSLLTAVLRRKPLLALALTLLGSTVVVFITMDHHQGRLLAFAAVDIALGCVVATRSRRVSAAAVAVTVAVQLLSIAGVGAEDLVGALVIALLAVATSCTIGLLSRERSEHAAALRAQEVAEAVTAERLRIARELHDMVAHSIGIIAIQAGAGSRIIETRPAEAGEALRAIESTSRETLSGLRRTLTALRRADAADPAHTTDAPATPAPAPGLADLDRLAAATADAGVRVELCRGGRPRPLPAEIDLAAYRIVQEAVTNVVRHAGTGRCRVAVGYGDEELSVEITDEGPGVRAGGAPDAGFGITGMRERVSLLHGRFSAGPRPEGGFRVTAALPAPVPVSVEAPRP